MIERQGPLLLSRQCELLGLGRAALYYRAVKPGAYELELMALIDRQYLQTPFYGSRRMAAWLQAQGHAVNRKRVQRLMQRMGLAAIYQRPRTSRPAPSIGSIRTFYAGLGSSGSASAHGVAISMDVRGRFADNIFVERLWRSLKYEEVYLKAYENVAEARQDITAYFEFYNYQRLHQALAYRTPRQVFDEAAPLVSSARGENAGACPIRSAQ